PDGVERDGEWDDVHGGHRRDDRRDVALQPADGDGHGVRAVRGGAAPVASAELLAFRSVRGAVITGAAVHFTGFGIGGYSPASERCFTNAVNRATSALVSSMAAGTSVRPSP